MNLLLNQPNPDWDKKKRIAIACLLYAVVLILWEPGMGSELGQDFRSFYKPVAIQIINGHGFAASDGLADRYPPGYPLILVPILALARTAVLSERLMLVALDLSCLYTGALLLCLISRRLTEERSAALPAWLWVTYPPVVFSVGRGLTELPFSVALFGMVAVLLSGRGLRFSTLAGLICGAAMLIRPAGLAMLVGATVWLLALGPWRHRLSRAGVFVAAAIVVILPWELFVLDRTGEWIFLSTGGRDSVFDGLTQFVGQKPYRVAAERNDRVLSVQRRVVAASPQLRGVGDIASFMVVELRRNPLGVLELYAVKAVRAWYATDSMRHEGPLLVMQIPYLTFSLLGAAALVRRGGDQRQSVLLLLLLTACFWVLTVAVLSILRYMVPAMGILFVCVIGLIKMTRLKKENNKGFESRFTAFRSPW